MLLSCSLAVVFIPPVAHGADTPAQFESPALEQRYRALIDELRCLVCQNQTLADSHADLAQDLRDELVRQLTAGKSDDEIKSFLVDRYGDFVLYRPPLKGATWLLWLGPFVLLLCALLLIVRRRRGAPGAPAQLSADERQRLNALLPDRRDPPPR